MTGLSQTATGTAAQIHPLRIALICLGFALLGATLVGANNAGLYVTVAMMAACVVGPLWYFWVSDEFDWFEPIHPVGAIYFIYFGLGAIWTVQSPHLVAYDRYIVPYVPISAFYCLLGYFAMLAGYFGPWHQKRTVEPIPEWPRGAIFMLATGAAGFVGFLGTAIIERAVLSHARIRTGASTASQLAPLFTYAWCLAWLLYFSGKMSRSQRIGLFGVLVPAAAFIALLTVSDKSLIFELVGLPIIARWYVRRRIPWTFLVVLLLVLIFLVFPFYNAYRWFDVNMGQADRLSQTYHTVQDWDTERYLAFSLGAFQRRLAMINSVAVVVRDVGRWVPYANGKTIFMPTLVYFVPRVLWPDKPITQQGREFGRTFRVTNVFTRSTYIAATVPGELYWNFHLPGILVGMAFLGILLRGLYRRYGTSVDLDPARRAVYMVLLVRFVYLGSVIAVEGVILVRLLIMLAAARWVGRYIGLIQPRPEGESAPAGP